MNTLTISANIFNDSALAIDYLAAGQVPQRGAIDRAKLLQLKITGLYTAYIGEAVFAEVEGLLADTMGQIAPFEKRSADAKDLDEIVGLFFNSAPPA